MIVIIISLLSLLHLLKNTDMAIGIKSFAIHSYPACSVYTFRAFKILIANASALYPSLDLSTSYTISLHHQTIFDRTTTSEADISMAAWP